MKQTYRSYKNKKTNETEEELSKRFIYTLLGITGVMVFIVLAFFVFAPAFGSFFGLLSVNRNKTEDKVNIKTNPPVLTNMPEASKENKISITGYANVGTTIKLFVNGPEAAQTTVGSDGLFNFSDVQLISGKNTIFARSIEGTVESDPSATYVVTVDTQAPKLEIESPKDGETVKNLDKRITVVGKVDEKATIKINEGMVVLKPDLTFEYTMSVSEGNVTIKVEATDTAGNKSEEELKVKYSKQS